MRWLVDLHCHSVASGHAYSTVQEMARAAADKGLKMFALTDHGPAMPGGPHLYHFGNLRVLPETICGVRVLKGVEANIIGLDGTLDLPDQYLAKLEIVLAGFHTYCFPADQGIVTNTDAMLKAMAHPLVDVIVHPGNPEFQIDPEVIVQGAKHYGKAIEINNSSLGGSRKGSATNCAAIARLAAEYGVLISLGSDSHYADWVGELTAAWDLCQRQGVKEEQILNRSPETVLAYLEQRRRTGTCK